MQHFIMTNPAPEAFNSALHSIVSHGDMLEKILISDVWDAATKSSVPIVDMIYVPAPSKKSPIHSPEVIKYSFTPHPLDFLLDKTKEKLFFVEREDSKE